MEEQLRDFTVCHDDSRMPARYRVYQTATPRSYETGGRSLQNDEWVVRTMDDETVFGVELYRRSYAEAVAHGWLTDYRIIALGVHDPDAYHLANELAQNQTGNQGLTTSNFLKGLALALVMGGGLRRDGVTLHSSISFMNTVKASREMTDVLNSQAVREWVQQRLSEAGHEGPVVHYTFEHLDASSQVTTREMAKTRLSQGSAEQPHGILNVGIFGEGVDAPSLSAVGFLEPRRSPVEVIQAVGRVMRRSPDKSMGYIICPLLIPAHGDAETWLRTKSPDEGWRELGQILQALRAHDGRIEHELSALMQIYIPPPPSDDQCTMVTLGRSERKTVSHHLHVGGVGQVERVVRQVLKGERSIQEVLRPVPGIMSTANPQPAERDGVDIDGVHGREAPVTPPPEVSRIVSGRRHHDGSIELREADVARHRKTNRQEKKGTVDIRKSKKIGRDMVNGKTGVPLRTRPRPSAKERLEGRVLTLLDQTRAEEMGLYVNLLTKSGLGGNRAERDVNILQDSIAEAKRHLQQDDLGPLLDGHFGLDALTEERRDEQADGCTIASLLFMNAAMLHQRIAAGAWMPDISGMDAVKSAVDAAQELYTQWNHITRRDFLPVMEPAIDVIETVQKSGRREGLNRALRHLAAEAERIAESYADLGADHAGPLFNEVMGNQASDGAFFTRPPAASLLACLALDAAPGDEDWVSETTWKKHRTVDLACGSGTLLAAVLTEMKRRAQAQGTDMKRLAELQKLAVEEVIAGFDFNPVSLQLAAAQLIAGNRDVTYRNIGLHRMGYGPKDDGCVAVGTLELLGQKRILLNDAELDLGDEDLASEQLRMAEDDPMLEDAMNAARDVRIVVMNPPFTNRTKMGEKYPNDVQKAMRVRVDGLERLLMQADPAREGFGDKNSIEPLFVALADLCLDRSKGILAMINPTIALTAPSAQQKRIILAQRFHIHTLLTCHQPGQVNLSQNTSINESIIIARRHEGERPPTRIINLDRLPADEQEVNALHHCLSVCSAGQIADGWGEVSTWPVASVEAGDWSAGVWRSPRLAEAAVRLAHDDRLPRLDDQGMMPKRTGDSLYSKFAESTSGAPGSLPILKSKGADGQARIEARPDEYRIPNQDGGTGGIFDSNEHPEIHKLRRKAGHLLVTAGQDNRTARLTAVASDDSHVGVGWMPIPGIPPDSAKGTAVFLNSTAGRLQLMRNAGKKLEFPTYNPASWASVRIPDLTNLRVYEILAECWQETSTMKVPQFRDGECEVRRLWDEAVAKAMGWDSGELAELRQLLHREPHVRGLGYNHYGEADINDPHA